MISPAVARRLAEHPDFWILPDLGITPFSLHPMFGRWQGVIEWRVDLWPGASVSWAVQRLTWS